MPEIPSVVLDPDRLKPSDLRRAKAVLADIIGDRDPMELADPLGGDFGEWFAFMVWCFRSREDPAFTWEQALDVEFGAAQLPTQLTQVTAEVSANGAAAATNGAAAAATADAAAPKRGKASKATTS